MHFIFVMFSATFSKYTFKYLCFYNALKKLTSVRENIYLFMYPINKVRTVILKLEQQYSSTLTRTLIGSKAPSQQC